MPSFSPVITSAFSTAFAIWLYVYGFTFIRSGGTGCGLCLGFKGIGREVADVSAMNNEDNTDTSDSGEIVHGCETVTVSKACQQHQTARACTYEGYEEAKSLYICHFFFTFFAADKFNRIICLPSTSLSTSRYNIMKSMPWAEVVSSRKSALHLRVYRVQSSYFTAQIYNLRN